MEISDDRARTGARISSCCRLDDGSGSCCCSCCCGSGVGRRVAGIVSVVCCFLLCCTLGISYTFGNIDPYLTSYLRNATSDTWVDYADTLWISQASTISANIAMPLLGLLAGHVHLKLVILLGILSHAASLFGTFWAVQESLLAVVATYGLVQGMAHAVIYPSAMSIAIRWFPERRGFICGLVLTGYGLGSLVWTELTTFFINRGNIQPDLRIDGDVYYTQPEVLRHVPDCFLLLGAVIVSTQLLCVAVLCIPPPAVPVTHQVPVISKKIYPNSIKQKLLNASTEVSVSETSFLLRDDGDCLAPDQASDGQSNGRTTDQDRVKGEPGGQVKGEPGGRVNGKQDPPQYHPKEVLKSRVFWILWVMTCCSTVGTSFVTFLFKAYGQTFISDDYFLATVASVSSIFNAIGRPFWGLLADKIGYRMVALIAQSGLAMLLATFVTCEVMGPGAFFVWVCAMFLCMCGFFTMIPALTFALFGSTHFNANIGLWNTHAVVGAFLTALVAPALKDTFGWHGMFYLGFAGLFASVLLNMSMSIDCARTLPPHMRAVLSLRR